MKKTLKKITKKDSNLINKDKQNGITLIALVITIIVLLILASVSIAMLTGDNGILTMASKAKEQTEIAEEKEQVQLAVTEARGFSKNGLNQTNLQNILNKNLGEGKAIVTYDEEEDMLYVKFINSERVYKINKNGEITYIGKESELILEATIKATPESNTTAELFQLVEVTAEIPMKVEDSKYSLLYAWSTNKDKMPEDEEFIDSNATGTGRIKKATITSQDTAGGNYYLWIRILVGDKNKTEYFGPYTIKDHTTLVTATLENESTSGFLGNEEVPRGKIKSINIVTSLEGHTKGDINTWDVSQSKDGKYLAWYEKDDKEYYNVTIGGNDGVVANSNSASLFRNIGSEVENEKVTIEGLENLDTGLVINMRDMFFGAKMESLDLNSFNTSNVTSLFGTFQDCTNLKELKVDNWNTSKVTEMGEQLGYYSYGGTFQNCSSLVELNISTWDTSNVIGMGRMFDRCVNLDQLDVSNFNTSNVKSFYSMFYYCKNLREINTEKFNTSNAIYINDMFNSCSNLTQLDVSNFDTSNVTDMSKIFYGCSNLTKLDVSNFNTSNVMNMAYMFNSCSNIAQLNVSNFNTSNVTDMTMMFAYNSNLAQLDLSNFDTSNVTKMPYMFTSCSNLKQLDLSNFNTNNVISMAYMFRGCSNLKQLDLSNFDTRNVIEMQYMFKECLNLTQLDLSNFDTRNVKYIENMFGDCLQLTQLNIINFNINSVIDFYYIFNNIPTTLKIITNQNTANWIKTNFPTYTNITIVD